MMDMALHGVDQKNIKQFEREYRNSLNNGIEKPQIKTIRTTIDDLKRQGLNIGRDTGTRVIRGK